MARFTLKVNGETHRNVNVDSDTPLLWVLRDTLGLSGTKFGCGAGLCRSCTVHMDGEPMPSCAIPVSSAEGVEITTIEGLSENGGHPVQRAWLAKQVPQCGYCQPGQIMGAAALLAKNPNPSDADIDEAMSPYLCRCGTYQRIRRAIHRAAEEV